MMFIHYLKQRLYNLERFNVTYEIFIDSEIDAKNIVKEWDEKKIRQKREECKLWWFNYKNKLQENIFKRINS